MKLKGSEYFYFKNLDQMPRVLKPSGNEMIVRIPISLVIKWPTMYRWVFPVGNSVADIPSAIGRMPDQGWPRGNGRRYTLGYLLSRLYMLMANSIKTLGYYSDSSSDQTRELTKEPQQLQQDTFHTTIDFYLQTRVLHK